MSIFRDQPELIAPFREGSPRALEQVYRHYVRNIDAYLRILFRTVGEHRGSRLNIADLVQEVFIRSFSASGRAAFDPGRPYGPYLRAIARNCFIDAWRSERRDGLCMQVEWPEDVEDHATQEPMADPAVCTIVSDYLRDLPPHLRGVYQQRYVLGHAQDVSCAALGITRRTLRTYEEHLKRGLRKALMMRGVLGRDVGYFMGSDQTAKW